MLRSFPESNACVQKQQELSIRVSLNVQFVTSYGSVLYSLTEDNSPFYLFYLYIYFIIFFFLSFTDLISQELTSGVFYVIYAW